MLRSLLRKNKTILRLREAVLRPYFAMRSVWPLWFYVLNRTGRRMFAANRVELSPVQARIAAELSRDGLAIAHLDELFPGVDMLGRLRAFLQPLFASAHASKRKGFLTEVFDTVPTLDFTNPFVALALDRTVLDAVNAYMGLCVKFNYFTCNVTRVVTEGAAALQSQRWHRDPEDKKMCKVFVYLSDVDESAGPFCYVRGSHYGGPWRGLFPQRPPFGYYPPDGAVERHVPAERIHACVGRAGTVVFCDTSGLHKGGYATAKERVMFTAAYISPASPWLIRYRLPASFSDQMSVRDPVVRFAATPKKLPRMDPDVAAIH